MMTLRTNRLRQVCYFQVNFMQIDGTEGFVPCFADFLYTVRRRVTQLTHNYNTVNHIISNDVSY